MKKYIIVIDNGKPYAYKDLSEDQLRDLIREEYINYMLDPEGYIVDFTVYDSGGQDITDTAFIDGMIDGIRQQ